MGLELVPNPQAVVDALVKDILGLYEKGSALISLEFLIKSSLFDYPIEAYGTLFKVLLNYGSYCPGPGKIESSYYNLSMLNLIAIVFDGPSLPNIFNYSY